jgi:hypothetical protein
MKLRAVEPVTVSWEGEEPLTFAAGEVKELLAGTAVLAMMHAAKQNKLLKIEGKVPAWPGSFITWVRDGRVQGPAVILAPLGVEEENWILVGDFNRGQGHLVRYEEVLEVNPVNVLSALAMALSDHDETRRQAAEAICQHVVRSIRYDDAVQG